MLLDFLRTMFLRSCSLESLFVQTNWKTFFVFSVFALHQTFSSMCRIKVMTFVSWLLTAWKIIWKYHLGIANTEISKPGDKSSTLLSTGIQFLIWPAAVSLDLFKIFSWLVIPCTTFCQIKWRQQCLDFHFFLAELSTWHRIIFFSFFSPTDFQQLVIFFRIFQRSNIFVNKMQFSSGSSEFSLTSYQILPTYIFKPLTLNVCLVYSIVQRWYRLFKFNCFFCISSLGYFLVSDVPEKRQKNRQAPGIHCSHVSDASHWFCTSICCHSLFL